jgi:hypothetical protein
MKKIINFLFFAILCLNLHAQTENNIVEKDTKLANEATISLKEESYDFGKIPQGKPVHHIFVVQNSGKIEYKLDNVQASCGCTTPTWEKDKIIPVGGFSDINVGYNAAAEGPFTKSITITYNTNQFKVITIKGEVWRTPTASAPANSGINELKD